MTHRVALAVLTLLFLTTSVTAQPIVIDDFSTDQTWSGETFNAVSGLGILGVERDGQGQGGTSGSVSSGTLTLTLADNLADDTDTTAEFGLAWDGVDGAKELDPVGLGGVDLTNGGRLDAVMLTIDSATLGGIVEIYAATDDADFSTPPRLPVSWFQTDLPAFATTTNLVIPFVEFNPLPSGTPLGPGHETSGAGADFSNIGALALRFVVSTGTSQTDIGIYTIPSYQAINTLTASMTDAVTTGFNSVGNPGETIRYTVTIENPSDYYDFATYEVFFRIGPIPNTTLTSGSVTTTQGTINLGNTPGDTSGEVEFNTISNGGTVTITFQVTINSDLAPDVRNISAQGLVVALQAPTGLLTDDPDTAGILEPTLTPVAFCGDGITTVSGDLDERCDEGANNGHASSCCTSSCSFRAAEVCRTGSGDICNPNEVCTGLSGSCPVDAFAGAGTVCHTSINADCDPQEVCPGAGAACPTNVFASSDTPCGDAATDCSAQDTCDDSGECLPNHAADTVVCNAAVGDCDIAENCDGSGSCPTNAFVAADTPCGDAATDCSDQDTCNDSGVCLPNHADDTVVCNAAGGDCDIAETCDGSGVCPEDAFADDGTACEDNGLFCDGVEACDGGVCTSAGFPCSGDDDCLEETNVCADCGPNDTDGDNIGDDCDDDIDGDGIPNTVEDSNDNGEVDEGETDPYDPDSDDDGLCDGFVDEPIVEAGEVVCDIGEDIDLDGEVDDDETDPLDPDSDDDCLTDGEEVLNDQLPESDPLDPNDPESRDQDLDGIGDDCDDDIDGDGLTNDLEDDGDTDRFNADSDSDGLCDGFVAAPLLDATGEQICDDGEDINLNGIVDDDETDPSDPDTDDDCLDDGVEVLVERSDPLNLNSPVEGSTCPPDRDEDGVLDNDDNCPDTPNASQSDRNSNGFGDVCEFFISGGGPACSTTPGGDIKPLWLLALIGLIGVVRRRKKT
jgi:hypothetical protein